MKAMKTQKSVEKSKVIVWPPVYGLRA